MDVSLFIFVAVDFRGDLSLFSGDPYFITLVHPPVLILYESRQKTHTSLYHPVLGRPNSIQNFGFGVRFRYFKNNRWYLELANLWFLKGPECWKNGEDHLNDLWIPDVWCWNPHGFTFCACYWSRFWIEQKAESNSVCYVQIGEITMCVGENTMLQLKTQVSSLNHNGFPFMCHRKGPARFLWVHIPRFISKDGFVGNVYMYVIVCMYNI